MGGWRTIPEHLFYVVFFSLVSGETVLIFLGLSLVALSDTQVILIASPKFSY